MEGNIYFNKIIINSVTVTSQAIKAVESVSNKFISDISNDKLVDFAFNSINTVSLNYI